MGFPDPLKDHKKWHPPKFEPITTLGKLGDYEGVPFVGSFKRSGFPVFEDPRAPIAQGSEV